MRRMRRVRAGALIMAGGCLALPGLLAFAPAARAGDENAGTRAASFLTGGTAPAIMAMGGASLGLGRDLQATTMNAAALGWLAEPQVVLAHASFADQTSQEWASIGARLGQRQTRWSVTALLRDEGTITGRDALNQATGDVTAQSLALSLGLAQPLGSHLVVGGAVHYVGQSIGDTRGIGAAFDLGAQVRMGALGFGMAGRNFGGTMRWSGERWQMPASFAAGVALDHAVSGVRLALDFDAPADYLRSVRGGIEWRIADRVALRGGYRHELNAARDERLSGPAFGIGAGAGPVWVDYGFVVAAYGGSSHRVALNLRSAGLFGAASAPGSRPGESAHTE